MGHFRCGRSLGVWLRLVCLVGLWGAAGSAQASNRRSFLYGGEAALTGGALMARASGTDALFYNPAGLSAGVRNGLNLTLSAYTYRVSPVEDGFVVVLPDGEQTRDLQGDELLAVPAALVFVRRLSDAWGLGLGAFIESSEDSRFDARVSESGILLSDGRTVNLTTGIDAQSLRVRYNFVGGLGWQVNERLRLGASATVLFDRRRQNLQIFYSSAASDGQSTSLLVGDNTDLRSLGLRADLGLQWMPASHWHLGVSLRIPALSVYTWGEEVPTLSAPTPSGQQVGAERTEISEFNVQVVEPGGFEVMMAYEDGPWTAGATFEVVPPVSQGGIIPLDLNFLWNVRAGVMYALSPRVDLGAGFFTDRSGVEQPDQEVTRSIDYFGWTTGVQLSTPLDPRAKVWFKTSFGFTYQLGLGTESALVISPFQENVPPTRSVDVTFHEFALNVASRLEF